MYQRGAADADAATVNAEYEALEAEARERLRHEGVPDEHVFLQRTMSMRYLGQWRSLTVDVVDSPNFLQDTVNGFHDGHEREFAFRRDDAPVEIYQLGLAAIGTTPKPSFTALPLSPDAAAPVPRSHRPVYFSGQDERTQTPVYARAELEPGATVHGPAVIEQLDSTTLLFPGDRATVDPYLNLIVELAA
jgi:N-methylhydantoinase A